MALKDIAINIRTTGVEQSSSEMRRMRSATQQMADGFERAQRQVAGLVGGFSLGLVIKESLAAALAVERLDSAMRATYGSGPAAARELQFIREEAHRLGLVYSDAAMAYSKFSASTKNTILEGEATRKIFSGVSEAVTALKLSGEESNGIFLALSQMMSKGKISAEELSGQLGERLPGAVKLTADAMGLTTQELLKEMQAGNLMSQDVLPKLAEQLHKTYGAAAVEAARGGQAEINRFNNALFDTKAALGTAVMPTFTSLLENVIKPLGGYITMFIGGIEILAVKLATLPDKARAAWEVIKSGEGLFSTKGLAAYEQKLSTITANQESVIAGIMAKYTPASSAKTGADTATEQARVAAAQATAKAAAAQAANTEAAAAAVEEADRQYQQYLSTMESFNKQIRGTNPYLDEHEKKLEEIDAAVQKAIEATPQYEESLRAAGEAIKANIALSEQLAEAIAQGKIEMEEYAAGQEAMAAAEKAYWTGIADTVKTIESMQPGASLAALTAQVTAFQGIAEKFPDMADQVAAAIAKLKAEFADTSGLTALLQGNAELADSIEVDRTSPWEQQTLAAEKSYARIMALEQEKLALMRQGSELEAAQIERLRLLEEQHAEWSKKNDEERWKATAYAASDSIGQIGQLLMQGNKDQFEAGKAMMYGQAIIAAALAIVQCYSQLGPIGGTIAAVGVGAATLAQISEIEATEYKPRAMGGAVAAGGSYLVGEQGPELIRMGSAGTVIPNHALAQAGEAQLKATRENTKAIARLSEGFHEVAGSLKDQVLQSTNNGLSSGRVAGMGIEKMKETLVSKAFDFFSATWGGGSKKVTGAGVQLGYDAGELTGSQYTSVKKEGGLFHKDKKYTTYSALDHDLLQSFGDLAADIAQSVQTAGAALGGLTGDLDAVSVATTKIDLRGMTEDQANKAIEDWFAGLAVAMTSQLGGRAAQAQLASVTRFGETSYEALMRITQALQAVQEAALTTDGLLMDSSIINGDLASSLVDAFGGIDKFTSAIDKYNKVVSSDDEYTAIRVAAAHREITAALADQVEAIPQTVAEYKALVQATDMTSPLYKSLIDLADSFDTVSGAAEDARGRIIDAARETLTDAMNVTKGLLAKIRDLQTTDSTLSPEVQYQRATEAFSAAAARALSGDLQAAATIPELVQSFLDASKGYNASGAAFQDDYQTALETMSRLAGTTGVPTVSESQRLIDQIDALGKAISDNNLELVESIGAAITTGMALAGTNLAYGLASPLAPLATMTDLRALLAGDQVSPLTDFSTALGAGNGGTATESLANIKANTASMLVALDAFLEANRVEPVPEVPQVRTRTAQWAQGGATWITSGGAYDPQYDVAPLGAPDGVLNTADVIALLRMSAGVTPLPQYASGGLYPGGLSIMGEVGPELVDSAPGYVYRADETRALFAMARRGADNHGQERPENPELLAEIRALRQEVAELRKHAAAGVKVSQSGFGKLIEGSDKQVDSLAEIKSAARRAKAA